MLVIFLQVFLVIFSDIQIFFAVNFCCSIREESEKLNVWIASLNLECLYGTDEALQKIFSEAVKRNDSKKVHLKMADIYIRNGKLEVSSNKESYVFFVVSRVISEMFTIGLTTAGFYYDAERCCYGL